LEGGQVVTDTGNTHMNDRKQPQVAVGADRGTLIGNMGREKRILVGRSAVLRQLEMESKAREEVSKTMIKTTDCVTGGKWSEIRIHA